MNQIHIPETNLLLSPIGLGTVKAGTAWDQMESNRIFDAYLDCRGNLIDTARVYGEGRSEEAVGNWLKNSGKRAKVILATKGGHPKYDSVLNAYVPRMSDSDMRADLEESLKALQTDFIDLYFYHRDNRTQNVEDEIETMERFVKEGKIRYYACSNWDTDRIMAADQYCAKNGYRGFVADQALLNMGMKYMDPLFESSFVRISGDLYQYHTATPKNLAMPYMGIAGGFFHKYIALGPKTMKTPPYCNNPYYTEENLPVAEHCKALMEKYHATVTQIVLGFFTQQDFTCLPLYGPNTPQQIEEAFLGLNISFTKEDYLF